MSKVVMPKPVRIFYQRQFFLFPRASSRKPYVRDNGWAWVVAYGFTRGHAKRRLIHKIDPELFWRGTVAPVSYTSE
jgi:hypothetical protein